MRSVLLLLLLMMALSACATMNQGSGPGPVLEPAGACIQEGFESVATRRGYRYELTELYKGGTLIATRRFAAALAAYTKDYPPAHELAETAAQKDLAFKIVLGGGSLVGLGSFFGGLGLLGSGDSPQRTAIGGGMVGAGLAVLVLSAPIAYFVRKSGLGHYRQAITLYNDHIKCHLEVADPPR